MTLAAWLIVAELVWIATVAIWIVLEKRSSTSTIAWTLALVFLPAIGIPIYLLVGPRRLERRRARYRLALAGIRHSLDALAPGPAIPPDTLRQARLAAGAGCAPLLAATRVDLLQNGKEIFPAIKAAIDAARHHVHLESYIFEPDQLGTALRDRLVEKAKSGVEVRLLVDAIGSPRIDRRFLQPLLDAGGEAARFHRARLPIRRIRLVNFRTHRKILVVDGTTGITGGMNVSALHAFGDEQHPPWRDTMVRIEGAAVAGLQATFFENWHATTGRSPTGSDYLPTPIGAPVHWAQVLASGPDREIYPIHELVCSAISAADERVWIACPYVVPDEPLLVALRTAAHRGADVRILVPRSGDSRVVTAAMRSYWSELTEAGVAIYEYLPTMLHTKSLIVDRELAIVGSANLDNRSFRLNFEVAVAIHGAEIVDRLARVFERDLVHSASVSDRREERLSPLARLAEATARLFTPVL